MKRQSAVAALALGGVLSLGGASLALAQPPDPYAPSNTVDLVSEKTTVQPSETVTLTAKGFKKNSVVTFTTTIPNARMPAADLVVNRTAIADKNCVGQKCDAILDIVVPASIPADTYTVYAYGVNPADEEVSQSVDLRVPAASTGEGEGEGEGELPKTGEGEDELPKTGSSISPVIWLGTAAILATGGILYVARRRKLASATSVDVDGNERES